MKIFNLRFILITFFIVIVNYSCSHCDDEDYTRDQKEEATFTAKTDSLDIK